MEAPASVWSTEAEDSGTPSLPLCALKGFKAPKPCWSFHWRFLTSGKEPQVEPSRRPQPDLHLQLLRWCFLDGRGGNRGGEGVSFGSLCQWCLEQLCRKLWSGVSLIQSRLLMMALLLIASVYIPCSIITSRSRCQRAVLITRDATTTPITWLREHRFSPPAWCIHICTSSDKVTVCLHQEAPRIEGDNHRRWATSATAQQLLLFFNCSHQELVDFFLFYVLFFVVFLTNHKMCTLFFSLISRGQQVDLAPSSSKQASLSLSLSLSR